MPKPLQNFSNMDCKPTIELVTWKKLPVNNDYYFELATKFESKNQAEAEEYLRKIAEMEAPDLNVENLYDLAEIERFIDKLATLDESCEKNDPSLGQYQQMLPETAEFYKLLKGIRLFEGYLNDMKTKMLEIQDKNLKVKTCEAFSTMWFLTAFHSAFPHGARQYLKKKLKRVNLMIEEALVADAPVIRNLPVEEVCLSFDYFTF